MAEAYGKETIFTVMCLPEREVLSDRVRFKMAPLSPYPPVSIPYQVRDKARGRLFPIVGKGN